MALTVHARLGRGRTVETFAATLEVGSERLDVVVKRPRAGLSGNEAFTQGLLSWAKAQAELDHERLVAVLESGRTQDGVYVIQEHVDGVALQAVLATLRKRKRTLSPRHAVMLAHHVMQALAYLHGAPRRGHGDVDPGEVLISYRGEVRLTDARLCDLEVHVGSDLLVPEPNAHPYRAPEAAGSAGSAESADVYSLALILLEMLIGHPVWTAESMSVADAMAALTDFTHIGQASPELTRDLLQLLSRALSQDPSERPTATEMQDDLRRVQATHELSDDELGLGAFVEAILPPETEEDAATQMMSPDQIEALAKKREASADWDAASVLINPEIAARAAAQFGGGPANPRAQTPAGPEPVASTDDGGQPLLAKTIPLAEASVASLESAAKDVERASAAEHVEPPDETDASRAVAEPAASMFRANSPKPQSSAPQDAKRAEAGPSLQDRLQVLKGLPMGWVAAGLLAVFLIVGAALMGGTPLRTVKLRATSEPTSATLWVDGVELGQTPFEQEVETSGELLELRFELSGHQPHQVSIGTAADELRYEARLEPAPEAP